MKKIIVVILLAVAAGAAWYAWTRRRFATPPVSADAGRSPAAAAPDATAATPRAPIQLDDRRRQLLGVRVVRVERSALERPIRAVGIVRYDETKLADVNLKLDGWIRKLYVNATGQPIRRGQPLFDIYSPDLLATENEYLLALSTRDAMQPSQVADARVQAERLVESARQRLQLWDLPADELQRLERTRQGAAAVTFRSPVNGFVIEKPAIEGMHVTAGQTLYKVADLSTVWIEADVHESDAAFIKAGVPAVVTLDARPGESLRGRAVYIYPLVDEKTRTLKVRFSFPNPGQQLKPGMYANVDITSTIGTGLTIPVDALIDAGREQLVFVAEGDGYYQPRRIQIGQRLGDRVQITGGLKEGEQIASGAAFFLDSESQLRAAAGGWASPGPTSTTPAPSEALAIAVRTEPDPLRTGESTIEARVADAAGKPVPGAQVAIAFYMAAMPSMGMPAMNSEAKLGETAPGIYRGPVNVPMSGRWDVTVTVTRDGHRIGSKQLTLAAE